MLAIADRLLERYGSPVPRYTSYPPATCFTARFTAEEHAGALRAAGEASGPAGLYVHIPFCPKLCLYCGCNVIITRHPERADDYLELLEIEAERVAALFGRGRAITGLHLGGGSPNFLTPAQLDRLLDVLERAFRFDITAERSIEVNPADTSDELLGAVRARGFSRLSLGVQDLDSRVLELVGRRNSAGAVEHVLAEARALHFRSVNFDLMYGLPGQTPDTFERTLRRVVELAPDRIALFGYAHVPWARPHQRALPMAEMPNTRERADLLVLGRSLLLASGYTAIGLDHFAREGDELARAADEGRLKRSFQGYTAEDSGDLIGLGASAISTLGTVYAQNAPEIAEYRTALEAGRLPTVRGLSLTREDVLRRDVIMTLMCTGAIDMEEIATRHGIRFGHHFSAALDRLARLEEDGLVTLRGGKIEATEVGTVFLRTIAAAFDAYEAPVKGAVAV